MSVNLSWIQRFRKDLLVKLEWVIFSWWSQFVLVRNSKIAERFFSCLENFHVRVLIQDLFSWQMCGLGPALFRFCGICLCISQRLFRGLAGRLRPILVWPEPWQKQSSDSRWQRPKMAQTAPRTRLPHLSLWGIASDVCQRLHVKVTLQSIMTSATNCLFLPLWYHMFSFQAMISSVWLGFDVHLWKTF